MPLYAVCLQAYLQAPYCEAYRTYPSLLLCRKTNIYRRAFEEDTQNSIQRYLLQFSAEANKAALKRHLGVPNLSLEYEFEAHHFAHGNVGCVIEWLRGNMQATPSQLAAFMFSCMPQTLRKAYETLEHEQSKVTRLQK